MQHITPPQNDPRSIVGIKPKPPFRDVFLVETGEGVLFTICKRLP